MNMQKIGLVEIGARVAVVAGLSLWATSAKANLVLTLTQGATTTSVNDPSDTAVTYNGTIGDYLSRITFGTADTGGGSLEINANITRLTANSMSPLTLTLTDSAFLAPTGPTSLLNSAASVTFVTTTTGDNVQFIGFGQSGAVSVFTSPQTAVSLGVNGEEHSLTPTLETAPFPNSASYTLTSVSTISLAVGSKALFDGTATVTPEPASLSMMGLGALALLRRRR